MTFDSFFSALFAFPTNVFSIPLLVAILLLIVDLVFNVVESLTADIDIDIDNLSGDGLFLPPVLLKVPIMVALTISFFVATVLSFYSSQALNEFVSSTYVTMIELVLIPVIAYAALFISAWLLAPIAPIFDKEKAFARVDFIGLRATVHSSKIDTSWGEVVVHHQSKEFLLNAKLENGSLESILHGEEVIIVGKESESNQYIVVSKKK